VHDLPIYALIAGAATSIFFAGATMRHRMAGHRAITRRPRFLSLTFPLMWGLIWSTNACLVASFLMAGRSGVGGIWVTATSILFAGVFFQIWLISQRCVSYRTPTFTFVYRWESSGEVSLHVNVRGPLLLERLLLRRRRPNARMARLGLVELRHALELSRQLPAQASVLTLASPWFGHRRHESTLQRLSEILHEAFPGYAIAPVCSKKTGADRIVLLITSLGREWHRVAGGRGIEVVGYQVGLQPHGGEDSSTGGGSTSDTGSQTVQST
jgi:hypothetical protein